VHSVLSRIQDQLELSGVIYTFFARTILARTRGSFLLKI